MTLPNAALPFLRSESGAITADWVLQAIVISGICALVLTSVSSNGTYQSSVNTHYKGYVVTTQYP